MKIEQLSALLPKDAGVEQSTMMGSPCLRYRGAFIASWFDRENSLIVKVSAERVNQLIDSGIGQEFNFTKKRFREWVLIPAQHAEDYGSYLKEALNYAKS